MRHVQTGQRLGAPACLGLSLLLAACGGDAASGGERIDLGNGDNGRTLVAKIGDEIDVTLQTIGPGMYASPRVSSSSIHFAGASIVGPPNPGGPVQLFRFRAAAAGRATITIPHTVESHSFTFSVDVL